MKYIEVKVDTNDADYVSVINEISDEDLALIMPLIKAIKAFKEYVVDIDGHRNGTKIPYNHRNNYPFGECCREDLGEKSARQIYVDSGLVSEDALEAFEDNCIPYPENGFHTIESIRVFEVTSVQDLLS